MLTKIHMPSPLDQEAAQKAENQNQLSNPKPQEGTEGLAAGRKRTKNRKCSVDGCGQKHAAKGFCIFHYQRNSKGVPLDRVKGLKTGSFNPKWKGGVMSDSHGRILVYSPGHPRPSFGKSHVYRYRLVMEKHLGRFLESHEIVHHKNGIKTDDRIENLELMTQSEHASLHMKMRMPGWSMSHVKCVKCCQTSQRHEAKGMCIKCYGKHRKSKK